MHITALTHSLAKYILPTMSNSMAPYSPIILSWLTLCNPLKLPQIHSPLHISQFLFHSQHIHHFLMHQHQHLCHHLLHFHQHLHHIFKHHHQHHIHPTLLQVHQQCHLTPPLLQLKIATLKLNPHLPSLDNIL